MDQYRVGSTLVPMKLRGMLGKGPAEPGPGKKTAPVVWGGWDSIPVFSVGGPLHRSRWEEDGSLQTPQYTA